ncbi:MAG: family 16 glycoside hydrolase, partial [Phenylobacterium sp.]
MLAADGRLTLRNDGKVLAEVGTGLAPATGPVHLAVHAQGPRLRVYAGNTSRPQIDLADASWEGGSFGLITEGAAATFDHAEVSFLDAFDGAAAWTQNAGDWAVEDGTFSQSGPTGPVGDVAVNDTLYDDAVYEADVRFPGACAECWAGMAIRKHFSADSHTQSGYLVYLRPSGAVSVFKVVVPGATTGRNLPGGSNVETFVDPVAAPVHLKVEVRGTRLRVFVGETDAPQIDVRDYSMNRSSEPGYLSLKTAGGHVHFDNVSVRARDTADVALRAARRRGDRVSESIDEQANGGRLAGDLAASFSGEVAAAQEAIDAALAQYAAANGASSERVVLSAALDALSRIQGLRWTIEKERVAGAVSSETAAVLRSGLQEVAESLRLLTIRLLGIRASITAPTSVMPGESLRAAVVLENGDESALKDVAVLLEPPPGWSVIPQRAPSVAELRRGARFELPFQLRVPAAQPVARGLPIEATITLVA